MAIAITISNGAEITNVPSVADIPVGWFQVDQAQAKAFVNALLDDVLGDAVALPVLVPV